MTTVTLSLARNTVRLSSTQLNVAVQPTAVRVRLGGGQSDWAEADSAAPSFIQNKPDIDSVSQQSILDAIGGSPGNLQVIKYDQPSGTLVWRDDDTGAPGAGEANVQVDWDVTDTTSDAFVLNKPAIFSGNYNDLTNRPTIPVDTDNYVDSLDASLVGQALTVTLGRTGSLADLVSTVTLPAATGPDTNDYVDMFTASLAGQALTMTLGRTGALADLTQTVTLPAATGPDTNDYVDTLGTALSGQDLTVTLGRTGSLADLTSTVTLPAGGGGGMGTTTDRQRIESVGFTAVASTTTQERQQDLGVAPTAVLFGEGAVEMVTGIAGEDTFTILRAGVYLMEWNAVITPSADRPEPCLRVLADADDAVLGETDPIYIREDSAGAYTVSRLGILVVPADNTAVKAIVLNCRDDNAFSVATGHSLHIVRGALGARGEDGMGMGGGADTNDYVDMFAASLAGQALTLTLGRTGALADLVQTVTLPTVTDTDNYVDAFTAAVFGQSLTMTLGRTGTLADLTQTVTLPSGGGGGGGDDAFDWATVGNTDLVPDPKLPVAVTGFVSLTHSPTAHTLSLVATRRNAGDFTVVANVPEWITDTDVADWAQDGNGSAIPENKLPPVATSVSSVVYTTNTRNLQIQLLRTDNSTTAGAVQLPDWLEDGTVEAWALTTNPNTDIPVEKLPAHIVALAPSYDNGSGEFSIAATFTSGTVSTYTTDTFPDWLEESEVWSWAYSSDNSRLPYTKMADVLRSAETFTYNETTRALAMTFHNITEGDETLSVTLPDFVASGIATTDVEDWALTANPSDLVPYTKMSSVVSSIGNLVYDTATQELELHFRRSVSPTISETVAVTLPDYIVTTAVEDWAKVGDGSQLPGSKIPNLGTGKINNLAEFVEDRVGNNLIQDGDNITWNYNDSAGDLTPTVTTNTADVIQIIRDTVHPLGPGLTESYAPGTMRLNVGLDIDSVISVGTNMIKTYNSTTGVLFLNSTVMAGAGVDLEDVYDSLGGGGLVPDGTAKISIVYNDAANTLTFGTAALNLTESNAAIDARIPPNRRIPSGGSNNQVLRKSSGSDYAVNWESVISDGPLDIATPLNNSLGIAPSARIVATAINANMGGGGSNDGVVDSITTQIVGGSLLQITLGRSVGADLVSADLNLPFNAVTDAALNVTVPASEPVNVGASRQAIAEAIAAVPGGGGGGGTDDQTAAEVSVDVSGFNHTLDSSDNTVQAALNTLDNVNSFQGNWQPGSYRGGDIVVRSGIDYISLGNNNTETPSPFAEDWSGLGEGFVYRGVAPIAATSYSYGQIVFDPVTDDYYFYTSTISQSVARADIPTHGSFHATTHILTLAEAINASSTIEGLVSGEHIANAIAAHETNDYTDTVSTALAGQNLTITLGRTGSLADLSTTVTLPGGGGPDTNDYADALSTALSGQDLTITVGRTGSLADLTSTVTLPAAGGGTPGVDIELLALTDMAAAGTTVTAVALTSSLEDGQLVRVNVYARGGTTGRAVGYAVFLSDDLRDKPVRTTVPTSAAHISQALPIQVSSVANDALGDNAGANINFWYQDDDNIYVNYTRANGIAIEIHAQPLGGGSGMGGGGSGDITAVTTASNSGLAGGVTTGAAALTLDLSNLTGQTGIAGGDHLPFDDVSASVSKRITVQNFAAHLAPSHGGLAPTTSGQLGIHLHGMSAITSLQGADEFVVSDDSTSQNTSHRITLANVASHLAGTNLTASADGVLSASGGGAITQATEATLGGVRGASALQAISSSGTNILGWSVNRIGQFVSVALPAMTQADIDNSTTGRRAVTGALIAANSGGGGTGDITGITTASNSGLAGGVTSGTATLTLDLSNLTGQGNIAGGDHLPFDDVSASVSKRITLANLASHLAGTNLTASAGGVLSASSGGDSITVVAGLGIDVDLSGSDYTVNQDIDSLAALPNIANADTLAIYDVSASTVRKVRADELESTIRIHKGQFSSTRSYSQGSVVETGTGDNKLFWIASVNIQTGQPQPSVQDPHNWWLLATPNHFRQNLDHTTTHNFLDGDWFRVDKRVFLATADLTGVTGNSLLGGHTNIVEMTSVPNPTGVTLPSNQLETLALDGTDYEVRSTFAVKYLSDRPVASEDTIGHLYHVLQSSEAFIGVDDSHISGTPAGTFNNIPSRTDLHVVATLPTNLNNLDTGDFYYHAGGDPARGGFEFYEVVVSGTKQLQNVHAEDALADSRSNNSFNIIWLGFEPDSTDALQNTPALASSTNYFFYNSTTDTIQRLSNTSFSGPGATHHYRWLSVGGSDDVLVELTQSEYDALASPDDDTWYGITDGTTTLDTIGTDRVAAAYGYVTYAGTTPSLADGYNITSVSSVPGQTGQVNVTMDADMDNTNYVVAGAANAGGHILSTSTRAAGSFRIHIETDAGTGSNTAFGFVVFGDLA